MVNVACMKWGDKYDASYVNILRSMVKRNLRLPHRFVCFTDDPLGIRGDVEVLPLPEVRLPSGIPERGWQKLGVFESPLADLRGTTLFLDLDVVIVGQLEPFFEIPGTFFISHDWRWYGRRRVVGNSSCFRFEAGAHPEILDYFRHNRDSIRAQVRHEQAYLSLQMQELGHLAYWPEAWCQSFKIHCLPSVPMRYFVGPRPRADARVVIFHGNPKPPDAAVARFGGIRKSWRPSPWIAEHWREDSSSAEEVASSGRNGESFELEETSEGREDERASFAVGSVDPQRFDRGDLRRPPGGDDTGQDRHREQESHRRS